MENSLQQLKEKQKEALGWALSRQSKGKAIEIHENFSIEKYGDDTLCYNTTAFPSLTTEEQWLLQNALKQLQTGNSKLKKEQIKRFLKSYCISRLIELNKKQTYYLPMLLEKLVFGFGALDFILADDELEEIAVIGIGKEKPVHVFHCRFGWLKTNLHFSNNKTVIDTVNKMAACIGRRLTMNSPVLNATLPDGSRLNAAINPVSFTGPSVTIRFLYLFFCISFKPSNKELPFS